MKANVALTLALLLSGCTPEVTFFERGAYPERLSEWGVIWRHGDQLVLADESRVYDLNLPLFSDYAHKLRSLYVPVGGKAEFHPTDAFEFPAGTIVTKTFFYATNARGEVLPDNDWDGHPKSIDLSAHELMETRLLVRHADGWDALPYVWRGDDAFLAITGTLLRPTVTGHDQPFPYLVPSQNQCESCHVTNHSTREILPIGLKARHLHRIAAHDSSAPASQLQKWSADGMLGGLPELDSITANATYASEDIDHLARSYLDINCGHCHNAHGPADTSALLLDQGDHARRTMGICKPPIASGRGSGGRLYSIVPGRPEESILSFRMQTRDPGAMMPEIGRSLVHDEGVRIVSSWIRSLEGACR